MIKYKVGDVIGNMEIIEDVGYAANRHHYYKCRCRKCGRVEVVQKARLMKDTPGCKYCTKSITDHKNKEVGGYKVISETNKRSPSRNVIWVCQCLNCGAKIEVPANKISSNHMPKCSCNNWTMPNKKFLSQMTAY